jgi:hypothetical protein
MKQIKSPAVKQTKEKQRLPLSMSPEARVLFVKFRDYKAGHRMLQDKADEVMRLLDGAIEAQLIFIFGPTGVGKSTLIAELERRLTQRLTLELEEDVGRLPHVTIEVPPPDSGRTFSWRSYYADALIALEDPLVSKKIDYPMGGIRRGDDGKVVLNTGTTTAALARAMTQALIMRNPGAVILDEAEHLLEVSGGAKFLEHLKVLRSIANRTMIPHILVGSYELLNFMDLNTTLRRRSHKVHMPRYRADSEADQRSFNTAVFKFQKELPCASDLMANTEFLYERSLGCVGLLKVWLSRALSAVLRENRTALTFEDLEVNALPAEDLCLILGAAIKGEARFAGDAEAVGTLREMLRLNVVPSDGEPSVQNNAGSGKKGNRRPGDRNPVRDPVGAKNYDAAAA